MPKLKKPGENPAVSGVHEEVGPRGGAVPNPRTVEMDPGDKPLPPTQEPGRRWKPPSK